MNSPKVPKVAFRLLRWFCKDQLFEELAGDLEESFLKNRVKFGKSRANRIYWKEVLKMIRPAVVRKPHAIATYETALLANYFTISFRNLKRHKLFSFINIFSLSVAMSSGLLVIGMINDLLKFDEFHERKGEIYRVISTPYHQSRPMDREATSPLYLGDEMRTAISGIQVTNLGRRMQGPISANDKNLYIKGIYADESFFDFLSFNLISGRPDVLKDPYNILLSESFVKKTFEDKNPMGESVEIEGLGTFLVAGVVADPPRYSHIQFEAIVSLSTVHLLEKQNRIVAEHDHWDHLDRYYNYVYIPENQEKLNVMTWLEFSAPKYYEDPEQFRATFDLQPINQIIPGPDLSDSIGPKMIFLPIIILCVIAGAILLSAIFNYTNLSMARSLRRAREVGVRKLNGATRRAVFLQFTIESIVLSILSLGIGISLFLLLRNEFISILPRAEEMIELNLSPQLIGWFLLFSLVTGLIAGIAPSLFFARLSSLRALRSAKVLKTLSGVSLRKALIVIQFTFSVIFVLAVVITNKQYTYSLNYDFGFENENILNVNLQGNDRNLLKTEWSKLPEIKDISFSSYNPGVGTWHNLQLIDQRNDDSVWVHQMVVDESYIENMGIKLIAGRGFEVGENAVRESAIIVNQTFVKNFGLGSPREALGEVFHVEGEVVKIVGVTKDFIYANLEEPIHSFVFRNTEKFRFANLKGASPNLMRSLEKIEAVWDGIDPIHRMSSQFLDDQIGEYYLFFIDIMKIFGFISFLAISISTLGLFGMSLYVTETRLKEVGIRKTFGATELSIIYDLTKGFVKMVGLAILIGTPICYVLFDQVILAQQYYRTEISFLEIFLSILFLLGICLLTISVQARAAARTNPAIVLRNE